MGLPRVLHFSSSGRLLEFTGKRMAYKPDFVVSDHSSAHYVTIML